MLAPAQAAFHLLLCCYALGDTEGMKSAFERLITSEDLPREADDSASDASDGEDAPRGGAAAGGSGGGRGCGRPGDGLREDAARRRALVQE